MAQTALDSPPASRIDDVLTYLLDEWRALAWVDSVWSSWEEHERLNFVMEWPIREDRLRQLQRWADDGELGAAQHRKFNELLSVVKRHQSLRDRLLNDERTAIASSRDDNGNQVR